jgi:hypothetical protein
MSQSKKEGIAHKNGGSQHSHSQALQFGQHRVSGMKKSIFWLLSQWEESFLSIFPGHLCRRQYSLVSFHKTSTQMSPRPLVFIQGDVHSQWLPEIEQLSYLLGHISMLLQLAIGVWGMCHSSHQHRNRGLFPFTQASDVIRCRTTSQWFTLWVNSLETTLKCKRKALNLQKFQVVLSVKAVFINRSIDRLLHFVHSLLKPFLALILIFKYPVSAIYAEYLKGDIRFLSSNNTGHRKRFAFVWNVDT